MNARGQLQELQPSSEASPNPLPPVTANISRQAPAKAHTQGALEVKDSLRTDAEGNPFKLFRVACGCGNVGCWYSTPVAAYLAHTAHVSRMERGL